jgi:transmembrane sensor
MAYPEEGPVRTTLLEGSVKLNAGDKNAILSPGEQAALGDHSARIQISHPDMDEVIAWKNGQFMFSRKNIKAIMRQLERWYDVDVVYQGDLSEVYLSGMVSLRKSPDELLQIFEETGKVHFQSEEGKIIVVQGRGPLK